MTRILDQRPAQSPGCPTTWGPPTGRVGRVDLGLHVCNREEGHVGTCRCSCGEERS